MALINYGFLVTVMCTGILATPMSLQQMVAQDSQRQDNLQESLRSIASKRSQETVHSTEAASGGLDECQSFTRYPGHLTYNAEVLHRVGDGYSAAECQQACVDTTSFSCMAVLMHKPATCFLTGYRLLNNYHTIHLARTCSHGPECFQRQQGRSAGYSENREVIPRYFAWSQEAQCLYCMARCEQSTMCVGVDVNREGPPTCVFFDMGMLENGAFDLFLRRC